MGDRRDREAFEQERFDVVFDMTCFTIERAEDSVRVFCGRCVPFVERAPGLGFEVEEA